MKSIYFLPSTFYFRLLVALGGFAGPAAIRCWMLDVRCWMFRFEVGLRRPAPISHA